MLGRKKCEWQEIYFKNAIWEEISVVYYLIELWSQNLAKKILLLRNHSKNDFRLEFRFKKRLGFQNNFFRSFWDWKNVSANNIIIFPKPLFENLTKGFRFLLKVFPFFQLSVSSLKHLRKTSLIGTKNSPKKCQMKYQT